MQFGIAFIATALLVCAAPAKAVGITFWSGAGCTGSVVSSGTYADDECVSLGSNSAKSIRYSNVPSSISFYESGGKHDNCSNGATETRGGGNGCATAPTGFNWESVSFF